MNEWHDSVNLVDSRGWISYIIYPPFFVFCFCYCFYSEAKKGGWPDMGPIRDGQVVNDMMVDGVGDLVMVP